MHSYSAGCSSKAQFIPPLGHYMLEKRMWCRAGKPASITHCSRLRRAGGSPAWFPLRNARRWKRGGFFFNRGFSIIVFRRAWFAPCWVEVGKCRGACHRKGSRGVGLAVSWLLMPPAMGKTQRRRCVGNNQSPDYLLQHTNSQRLGGDQEV